LDLNKTTESDLQERKLRIFFVVVLYLVLDPFYLEPALKYDTIYIEGIGSLVADGLINDDLFLLVLSLRQPQSGE